MKKQRKLKRLPLKTKKNMKKTLKTSQKGDNKKIEKIDTSALLERKKEREQRK